MHIPIRFSSSKKYNGGVSVEYDDGYRQELPPYKYATTGKDDDIKPEPDPEPDPEPIEPTEEWETIYDSIAHAASQEAFPYAYFWITTLADLYPEEGSVWRVTLDNVEYRCVANLYDSSVIIGNYFTVEKEYDYPFAFRNAGRGALQGGTTLEGNNDYPLKLERLIV